MILLRSNEVKTRGRYMAEREAKSPRERAARRGRSDAIAGSKIPAGGVLRGPIHAGGRTGFASSAN